MIPAGWSSLETPHGPFSAEIPRGRAWAIILFFVPGSVPVAGVAFFSNYAIPLWMVGMIVSGRVFSSIVGAIFSFSLTRYF